MPQARVTTIPRHPPHSIEAEVSVLGALMMNNSLVDSVGLAPEDFYRSDHQLIFQAIRDMVREAGETCDMITLPDRLRANGRLEQAGGIAYVQELALSTYSRENVVAYAKIIREHAALRSVIAYGSAAVDAGYEPGERTASEIISDLMLRLDALHRGRASKVRTFAEVSEIAEAAIADAADQRAKGKPVGVPTGIPCVDRRTGGLTVPRLWIVAGRPSLGKSALVNQVAVHAAPRGFPAYIASLEMDDAEIGIRARAHMSGQNVTRLTFGADEERRASEDASALMGSMPIYVDTRSVTLDDIVAQIVAAKVERGIRWAVVDNIQLVEVSRARPDRVQELSLISRTMKKLTVRLGIPILLVSHLNREVEKHRRKPQLSDLKDCGSLEQDADVVCVLHSEDEDKIADKSIQIGFLKNRVGRKGWCEERVVFHGATQTFTEIAGGDQ